MQPDLPETADIETSSDDYATRFAGPVGAWFLKIQEEVTLRMLAPYPGATVLDVGGGHGQTAEALVNNGYQLTVLDSAAICAHRIEKLIDEGRCKFMVGSIINLPFADKAFDVVISYRLLPHVTAWQRYLAEMSRVARYAVVLDYPEVQSVNYIEPLLFRFKKNIEGNTRPYTCYRQSQVLNAFRQHGFTFGDRYRQFFWPMVLHRKLKNLGVSSALEKITRGIHATDVLGSPVILKVVREGNARL